MVAKFNFSFKNKIALLCVSLMALLNIILSTVIYELVKINSYTTVDNFLNSEIKSISDKYKIDEFSIYPSTLKEWQEKEHTSIGRNAVFIQFLDAKKRIIDKSPNLIDKVLILTRHNNYKHYDSKVHDLPVRQVHFQFVANNAISGYVIIATPINDMLNVLSILRYSFILSFPFFLLILFFVSRYLADRSIKPIKKIIDISNQISHKNLLSRIPLSKSKDELYVLSVTINNLLDRIEKVVEREKSFISFTSHELKTPLSVIKGTLQVLIRKPRKVEEYEQKAIYCISQIDRLNNLIEDLLLLTQYETNKESLNMEILSINSIIDESLREYESKIKSNNIKVNFNSSNNYLVKSDHFMLLTIISNLISNAVKYSLNGGCIDIFQLLNGEFLLITIRNFGISIDVHEVKSVFNPFYRASSNIEYAINGHGIGLSIVKQFCMLLDIEIIIESSQNKGTVAILKIPYHKNGITPK